MIFAFILSYFPIPIKLKVFSFSFSQIFWSRYYSGSNLRFSEEALLNMMLKMKHLHLQKGPYIYLSVTPYMYINHSININTVASFYCTFFLSSTCICSLLYLHSLITFYMAPHFYLFIYPE